MTTPTHEATTSEPTREEIEAFKKSWKKSEWISSIGDILQDNPKPQAMMKIVELVNKQLSLARQEGERAGIDKAIKEVNEYLGYGFNGTSKLDKMSQDAMLEIITRNLNSLKDSHEKQNL